MAIVYRGTGAWGVGKGSNLTAAEIDGNFWDHEGRIDTLETTPAAAVEISSITQAGDTITIHMDNGDTYGPFNLPYAPQRPTQTETQSAASLTPAVGQSSYYFRCTHASGCSVLVPTNTAQAFPVDTELHFRQCTSGQVVINGDTGVTVNVPDGSLAETPYIGAVVTLKKVGTNEWDLFGALVSAT